jgi:hypothetical protein
MSSRFRVIGALAALAAIGCDSHPALRAEDGGAADSGSERPLEEGGAPPGHDALADAEPGADVPADAPITDSSPPPGRDASSEAPAALDGPAAGDLPSSCGGANQLCCAGRVCNGGHACVSMLGKDVCFPCGAAGGFCCPGGGCHGGGCCVRSPTFGTATCVAVGQGPCPTGQDTCAGAGRCTSSCGASGQACCASGAVKWCYAPGTVCQASAGQGDSCVSCGGSGQPCCPGPEACDPPFACRRDASAAGLCGPP